MNIIRYNDHINKHLTIAVATGNSQKERQKVNTNIIYYGVYCENKGNSISNGAGEALKGELSGTTTSCQLHAGVGWGRVEGRGSHTLHPEQEEA